LEELYKKELKQLFSLSGANSKLTENYDDLNKNQKKIFSLIYQNNLLEVRNIIQLYEPTNNLHLIGTSYEHVIENMPNISKTSKNNIDFLFNSIENNKFLTAIIHNYYREIEFNLIRISNPNYKKMPLPERISIIKEMRKINYKGNEQTLSNLIFNSDKTDIIKNYYNKFDIFKTLLSEEKIDVITNILTIYISNDNLLLNIMDKDKYKILKTKI